jgi:hypothetical protein
MTSAIHRLVYHSKNRIAGPLGDIANEVDVILSAARRNNPPLGITGALVFNAGFFAQVLEGPSAGIETIFEKIQIDQRHNDVQVLAFEAVESRAFALWSMAYLGRSPQALDLFGHIGEETGFTTARVEGGRLFKIVHDLAIEEEARVA